MVDDYLDDKIGQYERKLKQAEKAGKHHKAKKYAEKLERLRAEAAEQSIVSLKQVLKHKKRTLLRRRPSRPVARVAARASS